MSQLEARETVQRYFLSHPPGRILDIPCGQLGLSKQLAAHGFDCCGADLYSELAPVPGISLQRVDMNQRLPYGDASFDYIASIEGIEHMENTQHLLREFTRVLKPGGKIMVTTPNVLNIKSRLQYLLRGRFPGFPHLCRDVQPDEHLHINPVTLPSLQFAARCSGLRIERIHPSALRRKDWVYLPAALLILALAKLDLLFKRRPRADRWLQALLVTWTLLLGNVLIVSLDKPANAWCDGGRHAEPGLRQRAM
jgi:SAM-dependent methyltransferase